MQALRAIACVATSIALLAGCDVDAPAAPVAETVVDDAAPIAQDAGDARCRLATAATSDGEDCPGAADDDHDGVSDGDDRCPDTTPGITVDTSGCATTPD